MADIVIPGPNSGRPYTFRIAGTRPSMDEQLRIDSYLRQAEQDFAVEYEQVMGTPFETGEGSGLLNYLGEIPKGVVRGGVNTLESAALGIASLLPERGERVAREAIRKGAYALKPQADIGLEDTVGGKLGEAVGSTVPYFVTGAFTGGLGAAGLGAAAGAGNQSEEARAAGATPEERALAIAGGAGVGVLEALPVGFAKALGRGATLTLMQRLGRAAAEGGVEGLQEVASQVANNLIASNIYDPERGVFVNTGESLGYGAGAGALIQAVMDLAIPGKTRGSAQQLSGIREETPTPQYPLLAGPEDTAKLTSDQKAALLEDQSRTDTRPISEDATTVSRGIENDAQMQGAMDAAQAIIAEGMPLTITSLQKRLGVKPNVARGLLLKLRNAGLVELDANAEAYVITDVSETAKIETQAELEATAELEAAAEAVKTKSTIKAIKDALGVTQKRAKELMTALENSGVVKVLANGRRVLAEEATVTSNVQDQSDDVDPEVPARAVEPEPTEAMIRNAVGYATAPEGAEVIPIEETIPEGIAPTVGRTATGETTTEQQRLDFAAMTAKQAKLQAQLDELDALLSSQRAVREAAAEAGMTPNELRTKLQATQGRTKSSLYNVTSTLRSKAGQQAKAEGDASRAAKILERADQDTMRQKLENNFDENAAEDVKAQDAEISGRAVEARTALSMESENDAAKYISDQRQKRIARDPTTADDKRAILALQERTASSLKRDAEAQAAYNYFSKTRDVADAIDNIAFDLGSPKGVVPAVRRGSKTSPLTPAERGTGVKAAKNAAKWMTKNLSDASLFNLLDKAEAYATDNFDTFGEIRDREIVRDRADQEQVEDYAASAKRAQDRKAARDAAAAERTMRAEEEMEYEAPYEDRGRFDSLYMDEIDALSDAGINLNFLLGRNSRRSIKFGLDAPLHPSVGAALRAGNLTAALNTLAETHPDLYIRELAAKLRPYVGNTRVRVVTPTDAEYRLLWDNQRKTYAKGGFAHPSVKQYREAGADQAFVASVANTILINADSGMTAHVLLHEMAHAATAKELDKPSSPLRARLNTLYEDFKRRYEGDPNEWYGFTDLHEFVAEAMANQEFRNVLAAAYVNKNKASVLTQFLDMVRDWLKRVVMRRTVKDYENQSFDPEVLSDMDFLLQSALSPSSQLSVHTAEAMVRPLMAQDKLNALKDQIKEMTPADRRELQRAFGESSLIAKARDLVYAAFVPLRNMADFAKTNFPSAMRAYELITEHSRDIDNRGAITRDTLDAVGRFFKENPQAVDLFNKFRTMASFYEVDVRRPRSFYSKYTLSYHKTDADGLPKKRMFEEYETARERDERVAELNGETSNARTRAKVVNNPDKTTLDTYDYLKKMYVELGPKGQEEYGRILGLFNHLHHEAAKVFKARIDAMPYATAETKSIIYKGIFDKLFSEKSLEVYQPLQRTGDFWVTYIAKDHVTNTTETFKQSFATAKERREFVAKLHALPEDAGVRTDTIAESVKVPRAPYEPSRPSTTFVGNVGKIIQTGLVKDAEAAFQKAKADGATDVEAAAIRDQYITDNQNSYNDMQREVIELALDMMPERSFLQSYKQRQGVHGMMHGEGPVDVDVSASDTIDMLQRKTTSLNRQLADMTYDAKRSALLTQLQDELDAAMKRNPSENHNNLISQYNTMVRALGNIHIRRHPLVSRINSFTFAMTLGVNVSSVAMNLMSIPTIIAPYLAPKFGMKNTARAFTRATKVLASTGTVRKNEIIGEDGKLTTHEKDLGRLSYSMRNADFGDIDHNVGYHAGANQTNRYKYLKEVGEDRHMFADSTAYDYLELQELAGHGTYEKANRISGALMHYSEQYIRETTMIAAYDLELQAMAKKKGSPVLTEAEMRQAAYNAAYTTEKINGTIPSAAAPNMSQRGVMPMVYMFKRYPLAIMNMLVHTAMEGLPGKAKLAELHGEGTAEYKEALENRNIARGQTAAVLGSVALWAGAAGMPMYGVLESLFDLTRDDDEPSLDAIVRASAGELGLKGLGNYLFGVEMSGRIGLSHLMYREPLRAAENPPIHNLLVGMGGPAISIIDNLTGHVADLYGQGEYYRAIEATMPAAMRNALRAMRFATTGGAESTRGDLIQDLGPLSLAGQALGFAPAKYIQQLEINSEAKRIDNAITEERQQLLRARNLAYRHNDTRARRKAEQAIREFNRTHPHNRIDPDTKDRSLASFEARTGKVVDGMIYTDRNRDYILQLIKEMDSASTIYESLGQ